MGQYSANDMLCTIQNVRGLRQQRRKLLYWHKNLKSSFFLVPGRDTDMQLIHYARSFVRKPENLAGTLEPHGDE